VATLVEGPVERHLEQAVLRDIVTEEPSTEPAYRFKHILIRDVAYATLPKARRAELHRRVVDWLTAWAGDRLEEFVEIEAYHLEQAALLTRELEGRAEAGLITAAVKALERSALKAAARDDLRAMIGFAERALALEPPSAEQRLELEMLLVDGLVASGEIRRAREVGQRVAETAKKVGRHDLRGRALHAMAFDVWLGMGHAEGRGAGMALLNEAREELERAGDQEHLADVLFDLAWDGWWLGDVPRAQREWEEAAKLAGEIGDPVRETRALLHISSTHIQQGHVAEATRLLERAVALSGATSRLSQANVWLARGAQLYWTGQDLAEGRALVERAYGIAEESGARDEQERGLQALGVFALIDGDVAGAVARFERQVAILAEVGHAGRLPEADRNLAGALLELGDVERAEFHARRAVETVEPDDWFTVGSTKVTLGRVRDAQGREEEAARLIREGREILERTTFLLEMSEIYATEAEFHFGHGRDGEGERLMGLARRAILTVGGPASPWIPYIERRVAGARRRAGGQR
jgi:tetratricopeptide (TPR) repeat protein